MTRLIRFAAMSLFLLPAGTMAAGPATPRIPLVEGLVEVVAIERKDGDEEQVATVTAATAAAVDFSVEFRFLENGKMVSVTRERRVRREDLASSNRRNLVFQEGDPLVFPGSTLSQLSSATLAELKSKGTSAAIIGSLPEDQLVHYPPGLPMVMSGRKYFRGTYTRVGTGVEFFTVLVNGISTKLPVIHIRGTFSVAGDSVDAETWVLDDPANPLTLQSRFGKHFSGQTIRLDFPVAEPRAIVLQKALSGGSCRVALNGIYFDFGKASLLPISAPSIKAVAELMATNPSWTLRVEGHTDSVGTAAFNLDLSQRRAAAVRDVLVGQYKLPAAHVVASGFGATRPVAVNTTLEGRAANRRVELARTCP